MANCLERASYSTIVRLFYHLDSTVNFFLFGFCVLYFFSFVPSSASQNRRFSEGMKYLSLMFQICVSAYQLILNHPSFS